MRPTCRRIAALLLLATPLLQGCFPGSVEGKYWNVDTGEFAMELRGGKVYDEQGQESPLAAYTVRDGKLFLHPAGAPPEMGMALEIERDGDLSAGPLGTVSKRKP